MGRRAATAPGSRPCPPTWTASGPSARRTRSSPFRRSRCRRRGPSTTTYFEVPTNLTEDKWVTAVQVPARRAGRRAPRHRHRAGRTDPRGAGGPAPGGFRLPLRLRHPAGGEIEWNPEGAQFDGRGKGDPLGGTTVGNDGVSLFQSGTARLLEAGTTLGRVEGRRVTGRESVAHPALSHRAAVRVPWVRFLPPLSEPGGPISGTLCVRQHNAEHFSVGGAAPNVRQWQGVSPRR